MRAFSPSARAWQSMQLAAFVADFDNGAKLWQVRQLSLSPSFPPCPRATSFA
jgi:hypothetical protein